MPRPLSEAEGSARHRLGPSVETLSRMARVLERASGELSLSHYRVLAMVAAGDGRASRLAGRLALGKPAISAAVESLVSRGLLLRSGADPDRRATQLQITTKGRAALTAAESSMAVELDGLLHHAPDPATVLAAVRDLSIALDRRQGERDAKQGRAAPVDHLHS